MSDTPDNLQAQLSRRVQCFLSATGISQRRLAKLIKTDETHLANFLAGRTSLSAEKSLRLMQLLNASRSQLEAKLGKAATVQIAHFQESGRPMRLSTDGWVAGGGDDGTGDITNAPTARDLPGADDYQAETIAFLRSQQAIYKKAIQHIDDYLDGVQQRAKPNVAGVTSGPRIVPANQTSKNAGTTRRSFQDAGRNARPSKMVKGETRRRGIKNQAAGRDYRREQRPMGRSDGTAQQIASERPTIDPNC